MFQLFQLTDGPTRSESFADLNAELTGSSRDRTSVRSSLGSFIANKADAEVGNAGSVPSSASSKPFGLGELARRTPPSTAGRPFAFCIIATSS